MKLLLPILPLILLFSVTLCAHDPGLSTAKMEVQSGALSTEIGFSIQDAETLGLPNAKSDPAAESLASEILQIRLNNDRLSPASIEIETDDEESTFSLTYGTPAEGGALEISAPILRGLSFGHRLHFIITSANGERIAEHLWSHTNDTFSLKLEPSRSTVVEDKNLSLLASLHLAMEHTFIGFGLILFFFGLLLAYHLSVNTLNFQRFPQAKQKLEKDNTT